MIANLKKKIKNSKVPSRFIAFNAFNILFLSSLKIITMSYAALYIIF